MMDEQEILDRLGKILTEHCDLEGGKFASEQRLQEDLGLDSMGLLALSVEIENYYRIHLNEDIAQPPQTLGELAKLIEQRLKEAGRES